MPANSRHSSIHNQSCNLNIIELHHSLQFLNLDLGNLSIFSRSELWVTSKYMDLFRHRHRWWLASLCLIRLYFHKSIFGGYYRWFGDASWNLPNQSNWNSSKQLLNLLHFIHYQCHYWCCPSILRISIVKSSLHIKFYLFVCTPCNLWSWRIIN